MLIISVSVSFTSTISYSQNSSIPNNTLLFNDPACSNFSNVTTSLYPDRIQIVIKNDTSDDLKTNSSCRYIQIL